MNGQINFGRLPNETIQRPINSNFENSYSLDVTIFFSNSGENDIIVIYIIRCADATERKQLFKTILSIKKKKIIIKDIKKLFLKKAFKLSGRTRKSIKTHSKMRTTKTILKNAGLKKTFDKKKLTYNLHKRLDMGNTGIEHIRSRE